jgi:hypothetical protein
MEPPDWIWSFQTNRWFMRPKEDGEHQSVQAFVEARRRWHEQRDAWLEERGLVLYGMRGLSWEEFKRIRKEEPHRILRRPDA